MRNLSDTDLLLSSVMILVVLLVASLPETASFFGRLLAEFEWLLRFIW